MKETENCFLKVKNDYLKFLNKEKIFNKSTTDKIKSLKRIYIPISFWIENKYKKKGKTLFLGFSGGQGSGKTTVVKILKIILKNFLREKFILVLLMIFIRHCKLVMKCPIQHILCLKSEEFLVHMI